MIIVNTRFFFFGKPSVKYNNANFFFISITFAIPFNNI